MRWIFPIPGADSVKADLQPGISQGGGQGSIVPPIVVDGKVYLMTEWKRLYAIDVDTGVSDWSWTQEVDYSAAVDNCDPACFPPTAGSHIHAITYDTHTGLIWTAGYICQVFGIDAERGDVVYQLVDLCKDVPGNDGAFYANQGVFPPTIYTAENYLVHSWSTQDRNWGGRGFGPAAGISRLRNFRGGGLWTNCSASFWDDGPRMETSGWLMIGVAPNPPARPWRVLVLVVPDRSSRLALPSLAAPDTLCISAAACQTSRDSTCFTTGT